MRRNGTATCPLEPFALISASPGARGNVAPCDYPERIKERRFERRGLGHDEAEMDEGDL